MTCYALGDLRPEIHDSAFVANEATIIGQAVMHEGSSLWPGAVMRPDYDPIVVAKDSIVPEGACLHVDPGCPLVLGEAGPIAHAGIRHGSPGEMACLNRTQ